MIGIIILICISIIAYVLYSKSRITPREPFFSEASLPPLGESYQQQLNELADVDRVLDRPVTVAKNYVSKITQLFSKPDSTDNYLFLRKEPKKLFKFKDPQTVCLPKNHPIYTRIEEKQPSMFTKPIVLNNFGNMYYWDWKYPQKALDVRFAADPKGFCKKNPNTYPCYIINSRKDLI